MRFKIHLDGVEHEVEATADGKLVLDGETLQVKVTYPSDDRRAVQVGDKIYDVRVVENCADTGIVMLEVAGERVPMTVTDVAKAAPPVLGAIPGGAVPVGASGGAAAAGAASPVSVPGSSDGGGRGEGSSGAVEDVKDGIWAPVPGKIVEVFVKAGDVVEEGTALLVLEAMKMENELHASHGATVAAVLVRKGDQAEKGQLLVAFS